MNYIFINEQHTLLPEQESLINESLDIVKIIKVPSEGWDSCQIVDKIEELNEEGVRFIFVSPIPLMIALSVKEDICVGIMHNDKREKKEINGKIISVVAKTGWELIWI